METWRRQDRSFKNKKDGNDEIINQIWWKNWSRINQRVVPPLPTEGCYLIISVQFSKMSFIPTQGNILNLVCESERRLHSWNGCDRNWWKRLRVEGAWPERAGHTDANQVALAGRLALPGGKRACRCAGGVVEGQGHRRPNQTNPTQTRPGTRDCSTCGRVSGRAHTREQGNKGGELSFPLTATVGLWSLAALTDWRGLLVLLG